MPELPDVEVYVEHLRRRVVSATLLGARIASPFVVRSYEPKLAELVGKRVLAVDRLGKRIVFAFEEELYLVLHLMIAGRLRWLAPRAAVPAKVGLAAFDFEAGTLLLTEASSKKRASIHVVRGRRALEDHNPGGLEPMAIDEAAFRAAVTREGRTLKRTLTDPRLLSGIGNAYSDEILHRAKLSPAKRTTQLTEGELHVLFEATRAVLAEWTARLREEAGDAFPEKVTAFRSEMAVHGRYGKPCPVCGAPVQRIVFASNESNYCAKCQTGGKLLADRAFSRLLRDDWPKTLEELEERRELARGQAPEPRSLGTPAATTGAAAGEGRAPKKRASKPRPSKITKPSKP
jgi:formamidopyrimidine-DNA glycosylase